VRKLKTSRQAEIVDAAIELAGEKGLDAVSMRAVAARLGLTPMALYGYFRSKDDLLDAIGSHLLGKLPEPEPALDPLARLRPLARGVRELARRYPAVISLLFTRPVVTPDAVRAVDRIYQALLEAGVPDDQVARLERLFTTFVLGFVVSEVEGRFSVESRAIRSRLALAGPDELPAHHRLGDLLDPSPDWDAEFDADLADLMLIVESAAERNRR
jgi:AcrR family transcriptional regulator